MNFLAIDASTEACSVALTFNNQTISEFELAPQSHSLLLLPMIDRLLKKADIKLAQLDGLIFGQGPGSFTGVRIGVGVAQGLAFAADLKVVGVSTLQAMAQKAYRLHQQVEVIATIDARMSEVYAGYYQLNAQGIMEAALDDTVLPPAKLAEYLSGFLTENQQVYGVGTGWDAYKTELETLKINAGTPEIIFPHAEELLDIGLYYFSKGMAVSAENAQPVYVRDTVSWKKLPGR
ncbi:MULTISPECIES: tRNA (adenosine(37)-N6)-threonylcarbamoyltransferase complex dimerization subunit type 1 TsaB [unclassified Colwellia]|uniref:tRNA (adenosine(37)-N6)-threonylcarbamoyltransferase complex dimerization subunit type 1 TsaB n=1 Tax=unclassified Colwellia TaxID=196834 RepID=UPI0015F46754|nr:MULTISPECIES: tRNA (adenosine(37)-N6)-threonylcarbamoyltransferase complex dimerization subunit type 1 TsaB [unclassified Colwellia]MBA6233019.1 tRNA (adenosine(37)-N6)-threonylcarbamoyltransferase complex dimerization subunit type 1 TsaB [Colwellia sp. MB02u-7]MBA6236697.1 tRNA (adenosine(37)-N6)-threonylcarbamoyltransferase complex dimerization subunit type 1 TsaB [Colwellia sp. MB02u-11]MBA6255889.1 tRNA (adenosine(37)-N6)-threonylcarbamoyltransferase complex dimerization subunit type 1 Ts